MQLVYMSPVPWLSFAQRPHKFVEWFHRSTTGGDVLWVDPYPTRFPMLSDFNRLSKQGDQSNQIHASWLRVIKPSALPIEPLPGSAWLNALMWRNVFNEVDTFAHQQPTLLVIGKPSVLALSLLKRLKQCRSIYDAMDDFPAFYSGFSRFAMYYREKQLVRHVDSVLASSTLLKKRWSRIRPDVKLVHNSMDANTLPALKIRDDKIDKKVFGYIGTIASWFDWDWVIALANLRPNDLVRLIGPVFTALPSELPKNIEILPPCKHQMALLAMQDFNVGLIPFKKNDLTASVDPIKYYEYRALGLPVISTNFGEMIFRSDEDGTFISHSTQDIYGLVGRSLLFKTDSEAICRFVLKNSWEARFEAAKII